MEQIWLGRPADAAARFLEAQGKRVRITSYAGRHELPDAKDMRVMRCRVDGENVELVVCKFQTEVRQEEG